MTERDARRARGAGRPRTRLVLADDAAMAAAKQLLDTVEDRLGMSAAETAAEIGINVRTWRGYKRPGEPGPTSETVDALETLLARRDPSWEAGTLRQAWTPSASAQLEPRTPTPQLLRFAAALGAALAGAAIAWSVWPSDAAGERDQAVIEVYNKVVLDESQMREDVPAYLTTSPDCLSLSQCGVEGTAFSTGDTLVAVCQARGLEVTNRFGDTPNAENFDSDLWYGIRSDQFSGYLSEVWIHADHRGGLGLPECETIG